MGVNYEAYERRNRQKEDANAILDCKDWALAGEQVGGLTAVRGFAIFRPVKNTYAPWREPREPAWGSGFTEHWWCVDDSNKIVDSTGLSALADRLVPLASQDTPGGIVCFAHKGSCWMSEVCAWCEVRLALETTGHKRRALPDVRLWMHRQWLDSLKLRSELDDLKREFAKLVKRRSKVK